MTDHRSADEGTQQHDDATAEPITSAQLLSIMQAERAEWEALLAQVGEERMETPGVAGQWSVKDIVAYLTWYDRTIVEGAQAVMRVLMTNGWAAVRDLRAGRWAGDRRFWHHGLPFVPSGQGPPALRGGGRVCCSCCARQRTAWSR